MSDRSGNGNGNGDLNIDPVTLPGFSARAIGRGRTATVYLRGEADMQVQLMMRRFLEALHAEALRAPLSEIIVDVHELEFMTSSCFKELVSWANTMQSLAKDKRYNVRVLSNPKSHWQKRSLFALSRFAAEIITVE